MTRGAVEMTGSDVNVGKAALRHRTSFILQFVGLNPHLDSAFLIDLGEKLCCQ